MELAAHLQTILNFTPESLTPNELAEMDEQLDEVVQAVIAATMIPRAEAARAQSYRSKRHRSHPTSLAHVTHLSRALCARRVNHATALVDSLPEIYDAYRTGVMNQSQVDLVLQFHNERVLRPFVERDQAFFLDKVRQSWPIFRMLANAWARATREREQPEPDPDKKAFNTRKLVWGNGLDREIIGEFHVPAAVFEQFLEIVTPFYDELLRCEIREARQAAGEDPNLAAAEGEFFDLARSSSQRWLDALMTALRVRGSLLRKMKQQVADAGGDRDEFELDLDDVDAGVAAQVIVIVDQETVEREMARQHGHGDELQPRTPESVARARCETLSGLPISAATALFYAQLGSFRRDGRRSLRSLTSCSPRGSQLDVSEPQRRNSEETRPQGRGTAPSRSR